MKSKSLTRLLKAAIFGLVAVTSAAALHAQQEEKVLNIYNWSDYIGEDTIKNFEKETGIKVRYDNFDSSEILHAKLVAGRSGYDIVVTSTEFASLQIPGGLLRKLDKSKLPNLSNMDQVMQAAVAKVDPNNEYLVSWLWGFETVGINTRKVKEALGTMPMPANPWDLIFDEKYAAKMRSCGLSVLDAATTILPPALQYLGKDPYSKNSSDYKDALALLRKLRPNVTLFSSSGYINELANGSLCVALGYSGDINIARQRAIDSKNGNDIVALMPPYGVSFMDNMAMPVDAVHPNNAMLFMNYIMRPEVHAGLTNKVFYGNINLASTKYVTKEVADNKTVFPSDADKKKFLMSSGLDTETRRLRTRTYTQFKSGIGF